MPDQSHLCRLADYILRGQLETFVKDRREAGKSWRTISRELCEATNERVDVTHETLRTWFPDDSNGDAGEAA